MIKRRRWITATLFVTGATTLGLAVPACDGKREPLPKVVIIGFDGMDPRRCERLMDAGRMPNLARMRDNGGFRPLATSIPPQSPVAWSSFITGAGPGVHGIFDFVHRDPTKQAAPVYSAALTIGGEDGWEIGKHKIPLTFWPFQHNPTQTLLQRHGTPFWDYLDEAGIPVKIYDIPSNYPPSPSKHGHVCCLAGMGAPDVQGGFGTYQYFSEDTRGRVNESGGMRRRIVFDKNHATAELIGPNNTALKKPVDAKIKFDVYRHPTEPSARIDVQDQTIVLNVGEWSAWTKLDFSLEMPPFLPDTHVSGICRIYLQEVRPNFRLFFSPINIDPSDPGDVQITEPPEMITELAEALGLFYTTGFQEENNARSNRVFTDREYHKQARYVLSERLNLLDYAMDHYEDGLLFFYFSSTDLQSHIFWWDGDEKHPVRTAKQARKFDGVVDALYAEMDKIVGHVAQRYDDATVLVMSDHGFCNFRRQFNLNTWLRDNGYLGPKYAKGLFEKLKTRRVNWARTRAYGLGINGLYVNLKGRERDGIVEPADRDALLEELREKLLAVRDPEDGQPVIAEVYRADEVYTGPYTSTAPDLIIGYHRGYRASWETALGEITKKIVRDNDSAWSADHCVAADQVPGVIFSNRRIASEAPSLVDIAPTILQMFNVLPPSTMTGTSLFESTSTAVVDRPNN